VPITLITMAQPNLFDSVFLTVTFDFAANGRTIGSLKSHAQR
jgi:hypothetical protein